MPRDIQGELQLREIVGETSALKSTLWEAIGAAQNDTPVLITGETGSGKDLIARAIHRLSGRWTQSFIKIECAGVATAPLEASLFSRHQGRLEAANLGVLLLKHVESIPQDLQLQLLQVFEQRKFERPGEATPVLVDARLIATLSEIGQRVEDFWLCKSVSTKWNPLVIQVPALRERSSDIPLLASYFARKWARRVNKSIDAISTDTMKSLINYDWPGNVRELENVIERSVRLSDGPELRFKIPIENAKGA